MGTFDRRRVRPNPATETRQRRVSVLVGGEAWDEVPNFDAAGPEDKVFVVDAAAGLVVFGDGRRGRRPPAGARVTTTYRTGGGAATEQFAGVKRPRYFAGRLLTEADLNQEQEYQIEKHYLHNRMLHGAGVVSGLGVTTVDGSSPPVLVVEPGLALDPQGREVILIAPVELAINDDWLSQHVIVEYTSRVTDPVAAMGDQDGVTGSSYEDGAIVRLDRERSSEEGVTIARLVRTASGWVVDATFEPPRPR